MVTINSTNNNVLVVCYPFNECVNNSLSTMDIIKIVINQGEYTTEELIDYITRSLHTDHTLKINASGELSPSENIYTFGYKIDNSYINITLETGIFAFVYTYNGIHNCETFANCVFYNISDSLKFDRCRNSPCNRTMKFARNNYMAIQFKEPQGTNIGYGTRFIFRRVGDSLLTVTGNLPQKSVRFSDLKNTLSQLEINTAEFKFNGYEYAVLTIENVSEFYCSKKFANYCGLNTSVTKDLNYFLDNVSEDDYNRTKDINSVHGSYVTVNTVNNRVVIIFIRLNKNNAGTLQLPQSKMSNIITEINQESCNIYYNNQTIGVTNNCNGITQLLVDLINCNNKSLDFIANDSKIDSDNYKNSLELTSVNGVYSVNNYELLTMFPGVCINEDCIALRGSCNVDGSCESFVNKNRNISVLFMVLVVISLISFVK